jgi:sulfonate transport system substrate-binding protein
MKNRRTILVLGLIVIFFMTGCVSTNEQVVNEPNDALSSIRIGWQIPWATEGQLTQVLKKTELLKENGLQGDFKGFSYGGPLNEAALAGEVDVVFTADQPAAILLAKDPNWTIVSRLMYNRVSLYVPPNSEIQSVEDLKGKTVAMPFGAAAQRMALQEQKAAGLDPQTDVNNINLGIYEQSDLVNDVQAKKWGKIDALAGFDPTPAIFEEKGLVKNLAVGKVVSVILVSNDYLENNPQAVRGFLSAFHSSYDYYRTNVEQANLWFTEEASLDITSNALFIAADIEPNLKVESKDQIRLTFNEDDFRIMQEAADFIYDQKMIDKQVTMKDFVNLTYLPQ